MFSDSIDKIVHSYFAAVTKEPLTYKGETLEPRPLRVSDGLFRGYTCPEFCGGCCLRFSLDYLPSEIRPEADHVERYVELNDRPVLIYSDTQADHSSHFCRNLNMTNGRCGIHGRHPFTCDFELIRVALSSGTRPNGITTRLYGRGWAFTRHDGTKGAKCTITEPDRSSVGDAVRKLKRLQTWADHFRIRTCLPEIIDWAEKGPHLEPLFVNQEFKPQKKGLFPLTILPT